LTLLRLSGVLVVVSVLAAGLLLPYVGGMGLVAKNESDKFLNSTCDLKETAPPQGTTFYASDGTTVLATIFTQNRKPVSLSKIPVFLQQALVDTEDRRFYEHHGVDMRGLIRSAFSTGSGDTQGGSTLTMQYVKQVRYYAAIGNQAAQEAAISQNLDRKIQDAKCAIDLEKRESKQQILENYLNIAFFGENSYSVEAAAQTYFNKDVSQLTVPEAATLVGVLRAPSEYDPFEHAQAAKARRNQVLENMVTAGHLSRADANKYEATPIKLYTDQPPPVTANCNNAPATVANIGFFCDYVQTWLENTQKIAKDQIEEGGYKVVTTLNPGIQAAAQAAMSALPATSAMTALMPVVDPKTGNVLAMASSKPFGNNDGQLASSDAFTGYVANGASTYKYFTMLAALKAGVPSTFALGNNSVDHKTYTPKNCVSGTVQNLAGGINYQPTETLASAIAKSSNTYFVAVEDQLFNQCGLSPIVNTATSLGLNGLNQVDPGPNGTGTKTFAANIESQRQWSLTLGEIPTSPLELTGAYAAAANDGSYCAPAPVLSITDQAGQPVALKRTPCASVMTPQVARTAETLLVGDTKSGGTSAKVFQSWYAKNSSLIAGKTGTSTSAGVNGAELNTGFWFAGVTPSLAATVAIVNTKHPTNPASGIPGVTDAVAATTADASIASQYWLNALGPVLSPTRWTLPSAGAIAGSVTVPPVTGLTQAAATTALTAAGFKVDLFPVTCGSTALFGQVAYYSPQTAVPGTTVTLCMSNAQAPYTIPVPKPTPTPSKSTTPGAPTTAPPGPPAQPGPGNGNGPGNGGGNR